MPGRMVVPLIYNSRNSKDLIVIISSLQKNSIYNSRNSKDLIVQPALFQIIVSTTVEIQKT